MQTLSDLLQPQYIWIIVGFLLLILEFMISGVITVFFGVGALLVGILSWFLPMPVNLQLLIFVATSTLLVVTLRNKFKEWFMGEAKDTVEEDEFTGKRAVVTKSIGPAQTGKVEFRGSYWEAESDVDIPEGASVEIIDKKNITLIVKPL